MLRAWKLRVARRAFERAANNYVKAAGDFEIPLEVSLLRMQEAQADMNRARARIWELRS
jgi:hypothetical protein